VVRRDLTAMRSNRPHYTYRLWSLMLILLIWPYRAWFMLTSWFRYRKSPCRYRVVTDEGIIECGTWRESLAVSMKSMEDSKSVFDSRICVLDMARNVAHWVEKDGKISRYRSIM